MAQANNKKRGLPFAEYKDFGTLYDLFFDHSSVVDGEIKHFVREFETRRQSEDVNAVQALIRQQQNALNLADNILLLSLVSDKTITQLEDIKTRIESTLLIEDKAKEQQDAIIKSIQEMSDNDTKLITEEMNAFIQEIDNQFNARVEKLKEYYKIPDEIRERMERRREEYKEKEEQQSWFTKRLT